MTLTNAPDTTLSEATETRLQTRSGVDLRLRPVTDGDADIVCHFFDGLTPDDMQFRFLSGQSHLSSAQLAAMIGVDHRHREHLLAFDTATSELVASLLIAADEAFVTAEVAISVAPAYKTRGVGWTLLNHAVDLARARGLTTLRSIESRANRGAIELEREMGFSVSDYPGDPTLVMVRRVLNANAAPDD